MACSFSVWLRYSRNSESLFRNHDRNHWSTICLSAIKNGSINDRIIYIFTIEVSREQEIGQKLSKQVQEIMNISYTSDAYFCTNGLADMIFSFTIFLAMICSMVHQGYSLCVSYCCCCCCFGCLNSFLIFFLFESHCTSRIRAITDGIMQVILLDECFFAAELTYMKKKPNKIKLYEYFVGFCVHICQKKHHSNTWAFVVTFRHFEPISIFQIIIITLCGHFVVEVLHVIRYWNGGLHIRL